MKLTPTQQTVVDHLRANPPHKIMRYQGGFWSVPVAGVHAHGKMFIDLLPWWCDVRTVRVLERNGILRRTNTFVEEWRDTRELVPATVIKEKNQ